MLSECGALNFTKFFKDRLDDKIVGEDALFNYGGRHGCGAHPRFLAAGAGEF